LSLKYFYLFDCFCTLALRDSFEKVRSWYQRAKQLGGEDIEPILIGNKSDLGNSREVSTSEGQALAKELGVAFMETSALSGDNVEAAFVKMTGRIKDSVDRRGVTGVQGTSNTAGGRAVLGAGDRKMTVRDRCGCS
jgi:GTPase SAR1 family protein